MKPDGGTNENLMETAEVEPSEFFMELGMLILESRLPAQSVKGRQDGPHCPPAVGDRSFHVCDARDPLCKKASEMQKQIQALWRNHIPMCIEVLLFPDCAHGLQKATSIDAAPPVIGDGCILLEQWMIHTTTKKSMESCISSRALLQAMRSYLHFSQLSAWFNLTHGTEPRHIGYRVSPPAEFCTSTFGKTPDNHLFPLALANKSTCIKVTLSHLPRLPEIPKPLCHEVTGKQPCGVVDYLVGCLPRSFSPKPGLQAAQRSSSPKLDKPNVLNALSAEEREILTRPSKCSCAECLNNVARQTDVVAGQSEQRSDPRLAVGYLKSLDFDPLRQQKPAVVRGIPDPSEGLRPVVKDSGAVPKRLSLQLKSIPEDILTQHPRSPQHPKASQMPGGDEDADDERAAARKKQPGLKCGIPTLLPPFIDQCKDLIPEILPNSCLFLEGDSDSSSPDFDHFLSKTLMRQSEPLTLDEMEKYLHHLYLPNSDAARASGHASYSSAVIHGKLKPRNSLDRRRDGKPLPTGFCEDDSFKTKMPSNLHEDDGNVGATDYKTANLLAGRQTDVKTNSPEISNPKTTDGVTDNITLLSPYPKLTEKLQNAAQYSDDDFRPVFTVGDTAENDESVRIPASARAVFPPGAPNRWVTLDETCSGRGGLTQEDDTKPVTLSPRTLHKSTSCPSKPAFHGHGSSRANSLLKTVMKKELMTQQSVVNGEEGSVPSPCIPTNQEKVYFRRCVQKSASMVFHNTTGLPLQSSPVPAKKYSSGSFDYDSSLNSVRAIKNSLSCFDLDAQNDNDTHLEKVRQSYSTSAPASTNCLLGNFEESLINGRIEPAGVVNGFTVDIGASGAFCPPHITLPVTAFFFSLSDDHAPSPYLGHINLESSSKRGYHIPKQGTIQVTLFNPNKTVVKMFVVKYDMSDMPPNHQTVLRQRTLYMPVKGSPSDVPGFMIYLRYLIHLRFASSKSSKIYLHTDIRVIFARDKFELDSRVANYELRSFTEGPKNPKFSPRK